MRLLVITLLVISIMAFPEILSWSPLPSSLTGCLSTAGTYMAGKYYQICGSLNPGVYPYIQIFNGSTWAQSSSSHPGGGIFALSCTVCNEKVIVSGGAGQSGYYNYTSIYDPILLSWVQSTPMPISLAATSMSSLNNKCYLFGGSLGSGMPINSAWKWTPGDFAMIGIAGMPANRLGLAVAECNGIIYAFGGRATNELYSCTNTVWAYNPVSNLWSVKSAHLNTYLAYATAVAVGDRIYVIGGINTLSNPINNVDIYDTISDTLTAGTPLPIASGGHASAGYMSQNSNTSYTGHIFVSGGSLGTGAYLGTVTGVICNKVQPASLGNLKALYH